MVHRSATNVLHAPRFSARASTFALSRFFTVMPRWIVLCQVSFSLPTLVLPADLHCKACLGCRLSGILKTCPNHLNRLILIFLVTDCCAVLRFSTYSLTTSKHLIFMIHIVFGFSSEGKLLFPDNNNWRNTSLILFYMHILRLPRIYVRKHLKLYKVQNSVLENVFNDLTQYWSCENTSDVMLRTQFVSQNIAV